MSIHEQNYPQPSQDREMFLVDVGDGDLYSFFVTESSGVEHPLRDMLDEEGFNFDVLTANGPIKLFRPNESQVGFGDEPAGRLGTDQSLSTGEVGLGDGYVEEWWQ